MSRARKGVGFDEILGGPALVVNDAFWLWLEQSSEVWNRITADRERDWDLIVDTTDLFTEQYFTPDDREFWKLINQE